jgi:outer membrane protein assembly factor BamA
VGLGLVCGLVLSCSAQSTNRNQSWTKNSKVLLKEIAYSSRTLDTTELNELTSSLTNTESSENPAEIRERIIDSFQRLGYFEVEVKRLELKPLDPLAHPKPVRVEAEVVAGRRFKLGDIEFRGYRNFTPDQLRAAIPFNTDDYFSTEKVRSGLASLRKLYGASGYVDFEVMPQTTKGSDGKVTLSFAIQEGTQYRMGDLEVLGDQHVGDELRSRWRLQPGEIYDATYLAKFGDENRSLVPNDVDLSNDSQTVRNCREHTVKVIFNVDPRHSSFPAAEYVGRDRESSEAKKSTKAATSNGKPSLYRYRFVARNEPVSKATEWPCLASLAGAN